MCEESSGCLQEQSKARAYCWNLPISELSEGRLVILFFVLVKNGWLSRASLYSIFPFNRPLLYQTMGATSRDLEILRSQLENSRNQEIEFNAFALVGRAAPTVWYRRGQLNANIEYTLALLSQSIFSGTRTKLQTCPPKVDWRASSSNSHLPFPFK